MVNRLAEAKGGPILGKEAKDNTNVPKRLPTQSGVEKESPKFTYKKKEFNKQEESDYKKGFYDGLVRVAKNKSGMFGEYKKGKTAVGLNDRYNEGFSEGKDLALTKKNK